MRRFRRTSLLVLSIAWGPSISASPAQALELPPHKDALFAYGPLTAAREGGAYLDVPYSEKRDIDERDEVPERKVDRRFVDLGVTRGERDAEIASPGGPVKVRLVGRGEGASLIVLFVHGRGGDRMLGMNDWSFGGNFNRLKNLVAKAGGLYATADAGALGEADAGRVAAVINKLAADSPRAPIVLACASMGGALCWSLASDAEAARQLSGLVLLGSSSTPASIRAVQPGAGNAPIPVLLAHGSRDPVYPLAAQEEAFRSARSSRPIRFVAFDGGNHGTPIRMIDWRSALNWVLAN